MKVDQKKKLLNRKIEIMSFVCLVIALGAGYLLTSKKWSAYVYLLSDKENRLVFIGEYSSQNKCTQKSLQKINEGVRITRDEMADSYLCGKYCLEIPISVLTPLNLFCMLMVKSN
jgi:hypothetical protein